MSNDLFWKDNFEEGLESWGVVGTAEYAGDDVPAVRSWDWPWSDYGGGFYIWSI